jgi:hypothetical protein
MGSPLKHQVEAELTAVAQLDAQNSSTPNYEKCEHFPDLPPVGDFRFPILKAPQEIRDIFYAAWLEAEPHLALGICNLHYYGFLDTDERAAHGWNKKFFAPFKLWQKDITCKPSVWCNEFGCYTEYWYEFTKVPCLWWMSRRIRDEAIDLHFGKRLMLEMDCNQGEVTCMDALEEWMTKTPAHLLQRICQLHVLVKCTLVAQEPIATTIRHTAVDQFCASWLYESCGHARLRLKDSFTEDDALFKLQLLDDNRTLEIRTFCKLIPEQESAVRTAIQNWRRFLPTEKRAFDGHDLLLTVMLLKEVEAGFQRFWRDPDKHFCTNSAGRQIDLSRYGWMLDADSSNMDLITEERTVVTPMSEEEYELALHQWEPVQRQTKQFKRWCLKNGSNTDGQGRWSNIGVKYGHGVVQVSLDK